MNSKLRSTFYQAITSISCFLLLTNRTVSPKKPTETDAKPEAVINTKTYP